MKLSTEAQEALEVLWEQQEQDDTVGRDSPTLEGAAEELAEAGLVVTENGVVRLTAAGLQQAETVIRRHRLAERLLADILAVSSSDLEAASCEFEHLLHGDIEERVCRLLGHPTLCPHGHTIPAGECCSAGGVDGDGPQLVARLTKLEPGTAGTVAYLSSDDPALLGDLTNMGLLPGVEVRLDRNRPAFVVSCGESQFAMDTEMAAAIFVRPR